MNYKRKKFHINYKIVSFCFICIFLLLAEIVSAAKIHQEDKKILNAILKNSKKKIEDIKTLENIEVRNVENYFLKTNKKLMKDKYHRLAYILSEGVTLDKEGRIISLVLRRSDFNGLKLIQGLKFLKVFKIYFGKIEEIDLQNMPNLEELHLQFNRIKKIKRLKNLPKLRLIDLEGNKLSKIENLNHCSKIQYLKFDGNPIQKIEGLAKLKNLEFLSLIASSVAKIEGLDELSELKELQLSNSDIKKIEGLNHLSKLKTLMVSGTNIELIENMDSLKNLKWLFINRLSIDSLEGIKNCINLEYLAAKECKIKSMKPVKPLTKIQELLLEENPDIKKIEGLENAKELRKLDLDGTSIEKIENLENCEKLRELVVSNTNLKKLSNYKHLKNLVYLWFDGTPVEKEVEKHKKDIVDLRRFLFENNRRITLEEENQVTK